MEEHFPDAVPLIGRRELGEMWAANPRGALITVKAGVYGQALHTQHLIEYIPQATPYHYKDRGLIIGDAAHSQVPFYGQGLNCGLEDVRVLDHFLRECAVGPTVGLDEREKGREDGSLSAALAKYTETRHEDLVAICDMAMRH